MAKLKERPLSPHLQIYKPMFTMMMSIVHRITGVALYFGVLGLVAFLIAIASGASAYDCVVWFKTSIFGKIIMVGFTWALFHHMFGGLRHFLWDTGKGFGIVERERLAQLTLVLSIVFTVIVWVWGAAK